MRTGKKCAGNDLVERLTGRRYHGRVAAFWCDVGRRPFTLACVVPELIDPTLGGDVLAPPMRPARVEQIGGVNPCEVG